jgi:hypothetical protein
MEWQSIINFGGAALLSAFGWFCRQLWEMVQSLKDDIKRIEVELPTNYVRKDEMNSRFDRIEAMIEKLSDKLDGKVDK